MTHYPMHAQPPTGVVSLPDGVYKIVDCCICSLGGYETELCIVSFHTSGSSSLPTHPRPSHSLCPPSNSAGGAIYGELTTGSKRWWM